MRPVFRTQTQFTRTMDCASKICRQHQRPLPPPKASRLGYRPVAFRTPRLYEPLPEICAKGRRSTRWFTVPERRRIVPSLHSAPGTCRPSAASPSCACRRIA